METSLQVPSSYIVYAIIYTTESETTLQFKLELVSTLTQYQRVLLDAKSETLYLAPE